MVQLLPPVPMAALALAVGALGGVAGARALEPEAEVPVAAAPVADSLPSARAAMIDESAPASGQQGRHRVHRAADGMFYVWARVNGRRLRFLVDTGASVVVLTAADARSAGAAAGRYDGRIATASGRTAMAWTRLDSIELGARRFTGQRAAVVQDGLGVSLMGADMLARMGSVRIEGDTLELG